ncbi:MAG TPA: glucuronate isomerase [Clostridia bacterium]|nr:glucuronate isomerase [Clostridia bacterium]
MKKFMDENFLLNNPAAVELYHNYAASMPIIDYHCHISPKEIYENKRFDNLTEVWLNGDHYKWRLMRINGIDERYITGDAEDYSKFMAWAETVPAAVGNPVYHWTHLELQRYFGIYDILNEKTAAAIWDKANKLLNSDGLSVQSLIKKSNVKVICTTDDPVDSLEYHIKLKNEACPDVKVLPAMRPDKALQINSESFIPWIGKLEQAAGRDIDNYEDFLSALEERIMFFHSIGCRISDHAIDDMYYEEADMGEVSSIFKNARSGNKISKIEELRYKTYTLKFFARKYAELNWAMQLHINALRNTNSKMFRVLGPDSGYDSVNDSSVAVPLSKLLDSLEKEGCLPRVVLYTLNSKDNYVISSLLANFCGSGIAGQLQFGAAWWFNDSKEGMVDQMKALANVGLLSRFVGMLTDSRSFLSYTRHEYFRRILCNLLGEWAENGEVPYDMELLGKMVQDISYNNARDYFGL